MIRNSLLENFVFERTTTDLLAKRDEKLFKHYSREEIADAVTLFENYTKISNDGKTLYFFGWNLTPNGIFQIGSLFECEKSETRFMEVYPAIEKFAKEQGGKFIFACTSRIGLIRQLAKHDLNVTAVILGKTL